MKKYFISIVIVVLLPGLFGGCDSSKIKTWPVNGTVTFDGKDLDDGMIRFHPKNETKGRYAYGAVRNGTFTLQTPGGNFGGGAVEGEYAVTFSKLVSVDADPRRENDESYESPEASESLPAIYASRNDTPVSETVVKGKNVFHFDLKSEP